MYELIIGLLLFIVAASIATLLQVRYRYSYHKNPMLFVCIFSVCIGIALLSLKIIPEYILCVLLCVIACAYAVTVMVLTKFWYPMKYLYGAKTVPIAYEGLVSPQPAGQLVKASEVLLQDFAAWLISGGLIVITQSPTLTMGIFTAIVFFLHLPGISMFGKVYGVYFLLLSTLVAFLVPLLHTYGPYGFVCLYLLHLGGYVLMYLLMGVLGILYTSRR